MKRTTTALVGCALLAMACGGPEGTESSEADTLEILSNLVQAGFPDHDIQIYDGRVFVGRDAHVTLEASREMLEVDRSRASVLGLEQYRTTNLVSSSISTICINGRRISNAILSAGLDLAIENYNQQNLAFQMIRVSGRGNCDATITARQDNSTGGVAGFPSGGRPYRRATVGTGVAQFGTDVAEHVWTHELGHCIGFRHSDYFNRSISCGSGGNEGDAGVGAIHIPGTPTGATVGGSVMNSCFRTSENGEFTSSDRTALDYLY